MAKTSCIERMPNETYITLRQSYINICGGNICAAALLDYYEYRHNNQIRFVESKKGNNKRYIEQVEDYLIESSYSFVQAGLMGLYGRNLIMKGNEILSELGFISVHHIGVNDKGGKPTTKVLFKPDVVNERLKKDVELGEQRLKKDVATFKKGRSDAKPTFKKGHKEEVLNIKEEEREEAQKQNLFSLPKNEEEKAPPSCAAAPPAIINPKAMKTYDVSNLEVYEDVCRFWRGSEPHRNAINLILEPLGFNKQTENKKIRFFLWVKDIVCASIHKNEPNISVLGIHKFVVQRIGFNKELLKALSNAPIEELTTANKVAQNQEKAALTKEDELIALTYSNHLTGLSFSTVLECMKSGNMQAKRLTAKALDDIKGTIIYLQENNISYERLSV